MPTHSCPAVGMCAICAYDRWYEANGIETTRRATANHRRLGHNQHGSWFAYDKEEPGTIRARPGSMATNDTVDGV